MVQSKIQNNYTLNKKRVYSSVLNRYTLNKKAIKSANTINEMKYLLSLYDEQGAAYLIPMTAFNYNETLNEDNDLTGNLQVSIPYPDEIESSKNISMVNLHSAIVWQRRDFTNDYYESFFVTRSLITNGNYQVFRQSSNLNLNASVNTFSDAQFDDFKENNTQFNWTNSDDLVYVDKIVSRQTTLEGDILFEVPPQYFTRAGKYFVYNGQQYLCKRLTLWVSRNTSTVQILGSLK